MDPKPWFREHNQMTNRPASCIYNDEKKNEVSRKATRRGLCSFSCFFSSYYRVGKQWLYVIITPTEETVCRLPQGAFLALIAEALFIKSSFESLQLMTGDNLLTWFIFLDNFVLKQIIPGVFFGPGILVGLWLWAKSVWCVLCSWWVLESDVKMRKWGVIRTPQLVFAAGQCVHVCLWCKTHMQFFLESPALEETRF